MSAVAVVVVSILVFKVRYLCYTSFRVHDTCGSHPPSSKVEFLSCNNSTTATQPTGSLIVESQFLFFFYILFVVVVVTVDAAFFLLPLFLFLLLLLLFFSILCAKPDQEKKNKKNENITNQADNQSHTYLNQQVGRPNTSVRLPFHSIQPASHQVKQANQSASLPACSPTALIQNCKLN